MRTNVQQKLPKQKIRRNNFRSDVLCCILGMKYYPVDMGIIKTAIIRISMNQSRDFMGCQKGFEYWSTAKSLDFAQFGTWITLRMPDISRRQQIKSKRPNCFNTANPLRIQLHIPKEYRDVPRNNPMTVWDGMFENYQAMDPFLMILVATVTGQGARPQVGCCIFADRATWNKP